MNALVVLCTCPDPVVAERITGVLVKERLAACVNRIAGIESTYRWQGAIHHDTEYLLLIKTTRERFAALRDRIVSLHPYELPEIIAVDIALGLERYLGWIEEETGA